MVFKWKEDMVIRHEYVLLIKGKQFLEIIPERL